MTVYAIRNGKRYLQGFDYNEHYLKTVRSIGCQPHSEEEFTAVWGEDKRYFDQRTLRGYLETLIYNRTWQHEKFSKLVIEVGEE